LLPRRNTSSRTPGSDTTRRCDRRVGSAVRSAACSCQRGLSLLGGHEMHQPERRVHVRSVEVILAAQCCLPAPPQRRSHVVRSACRSDRRRPHRAVQSACRANPTRPRPCHSSRSSMTSTPVSAVFQLRHTSRTPRRVRHRGVPLAVLGLLLGRAVDIARIATVIELSNDPPVSRHRTIAGASAHATPTAARRARGTRRASTGPV
jgi:hypothetical protein